MKRNPITAENNSKKISKKIIDECIRCGTCCRKGGPSLHREDRYLIDKGFILLKHLFTIRCGEPAYDNIQGTISPAAHDIIKIKGKNGSWMCVFFNEESSLCSIHDHRPIECSALKCQDTSAIEKMYNKNRLSRKDLIEKVEGLWELIEEHQDRCNYEQVYSQVIDQNSIDEMVAYDHHLRRLVVEKVGIDPGILEFLFGFPMKDVMRHRCTQMNTRHGCTQMNTRHG